MLNKRLHHIEVEPSLKGPIVRLFVVSPGHGDAEFELAETHVLDDNTVGSFVEDVIENSRASIPLKEKLNGR
jgi:hypothetical protein